MANNSFSFDKRSYNKYSSFHSQREPFVFRRQKNKSRISNRCCKLFIFLIICTIPAFVWLFKRKNDFGYVISSDSWFCQNNYQNKFNDQLKLVKLNFTWICQNEAQSQKMDQIIYSITSSFDTQLTDVLSDEPNNFGVQKLKTFSSSFSSSTTTTPTKTTTTTTTTIKKGQLNCISPYQLEIKYNFYRVFVKSKKNQTYVAECLGIWIKKYYVIIPENCNNQKRNSADDDEYVYEIPNYVHNIVIKNVHTTPKPHNDDPLGFHILEVSHNLTEQFPDVCLPDIASYDKNKLFPSYKDFGITVIPSRNSILGFTVSDLKEKNHETYFYAKPSYVNKDCKEYYGVGFYMNTNDGYVLAGISSSLNKCLQPVKFVRIAYYIDWLNNVLGTSQ